MTAEEILRSIIEGQPLPYVRGFVIPEDLMSEITRLLYSGRRCVEPTLIEKLRNVVYEAWATPAGRAAVRALPSDWVARLEES